MPLTTFVDDFGSRWAKTPYGRVAIMLSSESADGVIKMGTYEPLSRFVNFPEPFEQHMDDWLNYTKKLISIANESLEG